MVIPEKFALDDSVKILDQVETFLANELGGHQRRQNYDEVNCWEDNLSGHGRGQGDFFRRRLLILDRKRRRGDARGKDRCED